MSFDNSDHVRSIVGSNAMYDDPYSEALVRINEILDGVLGDSHNGKMSVFELTVLTLVRNITRAPGTFACCVIGGGIPNDKES